MSVFWTRSIFKRQMDLRIVGGQNRFSKRPRTQYKMKRTFTPGVVKVGGKRFYFLGFDHAAAGERNIGKAAVGAIAGGLLTGGLGAIAGGAIGGRKKNTSTATLLFADVETQTPFSVTVACDAYLHDRLTRLPVAAL